ncbi:hypothetical protein [Natronorubrum halalkaliphilum]|nr:hypothetical protein [Natronorubrum halalkaliphilum]
MHRLPGTTAAITMNATDSCQFGLSVVSPPEFVLGDGLRWKMLIT